MKTLSTLFLVFGFLCGGHAAAQQIPVTLSFSNPAAEESQVIRSIMELQHLQILENTLTGKITGRRYTLTLVRSTDGREERRQLGDFSCESDTLRFHFASQPVGTDSMRVLIPTGFGGNFPVTEAHACILMETFPATEQTTVDAIPLMAVSQGETFDFTMPDGKVLKAMQYCNVRDSRLHPSKWHEQLGLHDYFWFELKFTDDPATEIK